MVSSPATSEAGVHAAGDTKSEHFEPARVRKLNVKQFSRLLSSALFCKNNFENNFENNLTKPITVYWSAIPYFTK
jgi:hypothetical protein